MSDLDVIAKAYDQVGINYVLRTDESSGYIFLVFCNEKTRMEYQQMNLDNLLIFKHFMEFTPEGKIASY